MTWRLLHPRSWAVSPRPRPGRRRTWRCLLTLTAVAVPDAAPDAVPVPCCCPGHACCCDADRSSDLHRQRLPCLSLQGGRWPQPKGAPHRPGQRPPSCWAV